MVQHARKAEVCQARQQASMMELACGAEDFQALLWVAW